MELNLSPEIEAKVSYNEWFPDERVRERVEVGQPLRVVAAVPRGAPGRSPAAG